MKRVGNVWDKIISYENLMNAHLRASKGKGHYKEVIRVNENPEHFIKNLRFLLANKIYYINYSDYKMETIDENRRNIEILENILKIK